MSVLTTYASLAADPTTQAVVHWIEDATSARSLWYGEGTPNTEVVASVSSQGLSGVTYAGRRVYTAKVSGLTPATTYTAEIRDGATVVGTCAFHTFPTQLSSSSSTRVGFCSDLHMDQLVAEIDFSGMAAWGPDILCVIGDVITDGNSSASASAERWMHFFTEWVEPVSDAKGHLVPVVLAVGNHEVGAPSDWTGVGEVTWDGYYPRLLFANPGDLDPVGENYGAVTVGDYLQLLILDSHTCEAVTLGAWLEGAIDDSVLLALPIMHSPLVITTNRDAGQDDLTTNLRNALVETLYDAGNVRYWFAGHLHLRKRTVRLGVSATDPGNSFQLASGKFVVEDPAGFREIGDGYRYNRTPFNAASYWYLDWTENGDEGQFHGLILTPTSVTASTWDQSDEEIWEEGVALTGYEPDDDFEYQLEIRPAGGEWELLADWMAGEDIGDGLRRWSDGEWGDYPPGDTSLRIRARDARDESQPTEWHTIEVSVGEGVAPPTGLSATGISTSQIEVDWDTVAGDTRYDLRYRLSGGP